MKVPQARVHDDRVGRIKFELVQNRLHVVVIATRDEVEHDHGVALHELAHLSVVCAIV